MIMTLIQNKHKIGLRIKIIKLIKLMTKLQDLKT